MGHESLEKIQGLITSLIAAIGEDPGREGLLRTPARTAKAWEFFSSGYELSLEEVVGDALFTEEYNEMVTVKDIDFFSICEHHLLPFFGRAHVAYIPNGKVIGLSKIPRIVEMYARRLQVQERLTVQIGEAIKSITKPMGVAVVVEGTHMCMQMRGVEKQNSYATTSHMVGAFETNQKTRQEFLQIISMGKR